MMHPPLPLCFHLLSGGPIGCEMAQAFQNLGAQVTLVELGSRLLPREDADAAAVIAKSLQATGVKLLLGAKAVAVRVASGERQLVCEQAGREVTVAFDEVLFAVGRRARTGGARPAKAWSKFKRHRYPQG